MKIINNNVEFNTAWVDGMSQLWDEKGRTSRLTKRKTMLKKNIDLNTISCPIFFEHIF